ncbi:Fc.00g062260.m01.CDS01 [Cosmosporella sp. VM-42]
MDNMGPFSQTQWSGWAYNGASNPFSGYTHLPSYTTYLPESMELYSAHHRHHLTPPHMSRATETKPRLSKEEVELLEAEFQKNHKPNSSTKKALAESMRVDNARINNWFQNRRARDKKEKNIREYAAKQKLEKEKAAAESGDHSDNDRSSDLVASSAPFPDPRRPARSQAREPSLPSDLASPEQNSETAARSQSEDLAASSPDESVHESSDTSLAINDSCDVKIHYFSPKLETDESANFVTEPSSGYLSAAETSQSDDLSVSDYSQYSQLVMSNSSGEATPSYSRQCFSEPHGLQMEESFGHYPTSDYDENGLPVDDASQSSEMSLKSPPSMDIASRRNRRPPHLAINASRSYSAGLPRTGIDMGRRADVGNAMRRVASATGTVRISKSSGTPRSPFFDRNAEALFQLNRSPNFTCTTGTIAPPTPNTPVVSNQQGLCEVTPSGLPLDQKYPSELVVVHDPTLRTPPTTPGLMENMFTLDSAYDISIPDEPLVTPGLAGSFPSEFDMPDMSTNVPHYVANGCSSQPHSPSYVPQMGPTYYGFAGGNAEYNWSDASLSARSSPGQNQRNVQFMNMTPSNFTHVEK